MRRTTFMRSAGAAAGISLSGIIPRRSSAAEPLMPLRVGILPLDSLAEALYAQDLGYFTDAGLDVKLTIFTNGGSALLAALVGNQLDIIGTSTTPMILARDRGVKVRYMYPGSIFREPPPNSALMVGKDSPIKTVADINGKTIAVAALKDITQYCVKAWIAGGHGNPDGVHYVEIPYSAMAPALVQGHVDAICQPEPFLTEAKGVARVLASLDDVIGKRYYITGWVATDEWPVQNVEARNRFIKAMQRAARWSNTHRTESGAILVKYSKIDPAVVAVMKRNFNDETGRVDPKLLQDPLNMMIKYGGVSPSLTAADLAWSPGRP